MSTDIQSVHKTPIQSVTPYKAIIFDFGGVVFDSPLPTIAAFEAQCGLPVRTLNYFLARSKVFEQIECGKIELNEAFAPMKQEMEKYLPKIVEKLMKHQELQHRVKPINTSATIASDPLAITEIVQTALSKLDLEKLFYQLATNMRPREAVFQAISVLKQLGYIVAALTNNWKMLYIPSSEQDQALTSSARRIRATIDQVFESYRLGRRKPDPELFLHVAKTLGVQPNACLMVDDLEMNLRGARQAGLGTILAPSPNPQAMTVSATPEEQVAAQNQAAIDLVERLERTLNVSLTSWKKSQL